MQRYLKMVVDGQMKAGVDMMTERVGCNMHMH